MASNKLTIPLDPPVEVGTGNKKKVYTEFVFDFESLTGEDAVAVDQELIMANQLTHINEYSPSYLGKLAARAAEVESKLIESLPIKKYNLVTRRTQLFLIGAASETTASDDGQEDSVSS